MKDEKKSKSQLIKELQELRSRIAKYKDMKKQQQLSENTLSEHEERYRNLYNNAEVGLFQTSINNGKILACNQRCADLAGYDDIEQFKKEYITSENYVDSSVRTRMLEEIKSTGQVKNFEAQIKDRFGKPRWWSFSARVYPEKGIIEGVMLDITDRKRTEEALRVSEEMYRELAEMLPQTVFELDMEGNITYSNQYGFESTGYTQADIDSGFPALQLLVPEDRERMLENIFKIISGDEIRPNEYTMLRKDGSKFPVMIYSRPIIRDEMVVGLRGIVVDITERKSAEEKIIDERNLAKLYLDILGHDVNNINQAIVSSTELVLLKNDLQDDTKKYLINLRSQAMRIAELVSNVHTLSKLKESEPQIKVVDLLEIINTSLDKIKQIYSDRRIKINHGIEKSGIKIKSNEYLQDLLDNIIDNAVKFDPNNEVTIDLSHSLDKDGNYWKLEFKDYGSGVPDAMKERIFKRLNSGEESMHGSGLGLTIAHEVVSCCGGRIWVEDRIPGDSSKGSNFIVKLPRGAVDEN